MTGSSVAVARGLVDRALLLLNSPPERLGVAPQQTPCQGSPVPYVDIKNVTDEDAEFLCEGCPLMKWRLDDGSVRNICLMLGRAEGASAVGYVYGGQVMRRSTRRAEIKKERGTYQ